MLSISSGRETLDSGKYTLIGNWVVKVHVRVNYFTQPQCKSGSPKDLNSSRKQTDISAYLKSRGQSCTKRTNCWIHFSCRCMWVTPHMSMWLLTWFIYKPLSSFNIHLFILLNRCNALRRCLLNCWKWTTWYLIPCNMVGSFSIGNPCRAHCFRTIACC